MDRNTILALRDIENNNVILYSTYKRYKISSIFTLVIQRELQIKGKIWMSMLAFVCIVEAPMSINSNTSFLDIL